MTKEELKKIIDNHQHWLKRDCDGWETMRADLHGADLRYADLHGVDFDHTDKIWFYTKHGKKVEFIKPVYCKDCKYADEYYNCSYTTWYNSPDDFCSRAGKKKGGEE